MIPASLLAKKREGQVLNEQEIYFLIDGFCSGSVADYQMSALAMAICIQGMDAAETRYLTAAMVESGNRLPRTSDRPRIDKHSTGGLGDKISLVLAPLLATFDVDVPMISGRGLGLTGGTLDKLEAIEGFQTQLSTEQSNKILRRVGAFICGASDEIAPADRRLYAIRDVTGTVESIPLITASILSKKIAARLDALVMDVKVGSAAFMKTASQAKELANTIIQVGCESNMPTTAIVSDMDQPLGEAVGNAIEVNEAVAVLEGKGPSEVRELTIELCANVLIAAQVLPQRDKAIERLNQHLDSGSARERFEQIVRAQGGIDRFPLPLAPHETIEAEANGWVEKIDCEKIGQILVEMGAGRKRADDKIRADVGVRIHARIGDRTERSQPLLSVYAPHATRSDHVEALRQAIHVGPNEIHANPLILERLNTHTGKSI
ncbi:thymidine phosphorylase [Novipirellula artificiosorum]|uniref:thymidine phosphorylase n=1 Tax=Novipirellula artificiosorum TaxID=2528016 RepID=A0A5C6DWL4_9BACT|nr:thymidine phosphorylase [Novipirellula artificiosorum]TWU41012.1 Pyrimidine-nucleoside phosphorylase [Novipirellula artificiosorum]